MAGHMGKIEFGTGGVDGGGTGVPRWTEENARQYLMELRNTLGDEKYDEFENIMKEKHYKRIDSVTTIEKAKALLRGHGEQVLLGFNQWIPERYHSRILMSEQMMSKNQERSQQYSKAMDFVRKVRMRFENEDHIYLTFCKIVKMFKNGVLSDHEVYQKANHLFSQHADLLDDFKSFTRDNGLLISDKTVMPAAGEPVSRLEEKATTGIGSQQEEERFETGQMRKGKRKMDCSTHTDKGNKVTSKNTSDGLILQNPSPAEAFFQNVKRKLKNRDLYAQFLKCINLFSKEIITGLELQSLLVTILEEDSDLMAELHDLLSGCEKIHLGDSSTAVKKPQMWENSQQRREKKKRDLEERNEQLLPDPKAKSTTAVKKPKDWNNTHQGRETKGWDRKENSEQHQRKPDMRKCKQHERLTKEYDQEEHTEHDQREPKKRKSDKLPVHDEVCGKNKTLEKSAPCFDQWEICTPGYRLVPSDFEKPLNTHYTKLGHEVLNDSCVSVPRYIPRLKSGKNRYEVNLFKCEDNQWQVSRLLELTASTALKVKEVMDYMQSAAFEQERTTFALDNYLSAVNFGCIRSLYEEQKETNITAKRVTDRTEVDAIMAGIRKNPSIILPVVHSRLLQKNHELSQYQADMSSVWARVQSQNHLKALTYRSPQVRQKNKGKQ